MELFVSTLIAIVAVFGGVAGWFSRGRLLVTIPICILISVLASAAFIAWNHSDLDVDWRSVPSLISLVLWFAIPFAQYIFTPCMIGGALMTLVAYLVKRRTTSRII